MPEGAETTVIRGPAATLARFMDMSRSIPTATSFRTLSVGELADRRAQLKGAGKKLSFTHLIAWAIVRAAGDDMPVMANSFTEVDGKPHRVTPGAVSLGLAVDAERKDGTRTLIVPVIKNASDLTFDQFVAAYDEAVFGARDNKLGPDAYTGANITLTNPGGIGTIASVPRLMPGQGTIVATGSIAFPPGMGDGGPGQAGRAGRAEGHDHDLHLRPPRDPGRRVGRVPQARGRAARRARTASTTRCSPRWAWTATGPRARPTATAP